MPQKTRDKLPAFDKLVESLRRVYITSLNKKQDAASGAYHASTSREGASVVCDYCDADDTVFYVDMS
jgi:hypothetical protein